MKRTTCTWTAALTVTAAAVLTACGGGGGGPVGQVGDGIITLSGTAATGAPMAGATVVVKDSAGQEVQSCVPCTVGDAGDFKVPLKSDSTGPFILLVRQNASDEPQVSMVDTTGSASVNVSPITTLIAARLAPSGDPAKLNSGDLSASKIQTAMEEVRTALKPLLDAAGVNATDNPLSTAFTADSKGMDKALDMLGVPSIVRSADGTTATVSVELKSGGSDTASDTALPIKMTLPAANAPIPVILATAAAIQATLPEDGISPKIKNLLQRMQDCYATDPADRRSAGATLASQITADVCKAIFLGNDPTQYLSNNAVVSKTGTTLTGALGGRVSGAFNGIFTSVKGIRFDQGEYKYTVKNDNTTDPLKPMNGDVVFTARTTVTDPAAGLNLGTEDVLEFQARVQEGVLKMVGNQSRFDLSVKAFARRDDMPAVADYAYLSTGWSLGVTERRWDHDKNPSTPMVSIFEKVVITSPSGKAFTLKPIAGNNFDYLGLENSAGVSKSASIRLNAVYQNGQTTGHPSQRFTKEFWANPSDWSDDKIAAIPAQGNWKFDITLTDAMVAANAGQAKNITQYRRTLYRSPTLQELKAVTWPALTPEALASVTADAKKQGFVALGANNVPETLLVDGWTVPAGAWAPTGVSVFNSAWDEGVSMSPTARKVSIFCAGTGSHCEKLNSANTGKFINTSIGSVRFRGRQLLNMVLIYSTRQTDTDVTATAPATTPATTP